MLVHDLELVLPARVAAWPRRVVWDVHEDLVQSVADRSWIPRTFRPVARALVALTERVATFGIRLLLAETSYADRFGSWPVVPNTTPVPDSLAPYSDGSRPRLVYVGRISWSRGLAAMIEVGRRLDGACSVELVGAVDADAQAALDDAVGDGVVTWHGYLPNSDALALTEGALAGLSLLGEHGNFVGSMPTKIFEYLARGVPVITTPLPLAEQVVRRCGCRLHGRLRRHRRSRRRDVATDVVTRTSRRHGPTRLRVGGGEPRLAVRWRRLRGDDRRWSGERQRLADFSLSR